MDILKCNFFRWILLVAGFVLELHNVFVHVSFIAMVKFYDSG